MTAKLYRKIGNIIKNDILNGVVKVGEQLPSERVLSEEMAVSRTVIREAIIMLEVEGFVEVKKGSGIKVISSQGNSAITQHGKTNAMIDCGPFELLQARQLFESSIAKFAAIQATKKDLVNLMKINEKSLDYDMSRDSELDEQFHIYVAECTQNSVLAHVTRILWEQRSINPYWKKLHEHIDEKDLRSWCDDHQKILRSILERNADKAEFEMCDHIEKTKMMLINATNDDYDRFLYSESPLKI